MNGTTPSGGDPGNSTLGSELCTAELVEANSCIEQISERCGCFDSISFMDTFPEEIRQQFFSAMAWVPLTDSSFCDAANQKVCDHYGTVRSCCCVMQTTAYRKCFFDNVLAKELPAPRDSDCTDKCTRVVTLKAKKGGEEETNNNTDVALGITFAIVLLIIVYGIFRYNRRAASNKGQAVSNLKLVSEDQVAVTQYSGSTDMEAPFDDDVSDITDIFASKIASDSRTVYSDSTDITSVVNSYLNKKLGGIANEDVLDPLAEEYEEESSDNERSKESSIDKLNKHYYKHGRPPANSRRKGLAKSRSERLGKGSSRKKVNPVVELNNLRSNSDSRLDMGHADGSSQPKSSKTMEEIIKEKEELVAMLNDLDKAKLGVENQMEQFRQEIDSLRMDSTSSTSRLNEIIKEKAAISIRLSQLESARGYCKEQIQAAQNEARLLHKQEHTKAKKQAATRQGNFDTASEATSSTGSNRGSKNGGPRKAGTRSNSAPKKKSSARRSTNKGYYYT